MEYLDFVDDVLDELECRKEIEYVQTILDRAPAPTVSSASFPRPTT